MRKDDAEIFKMFQFELEFSEYGGYRHSPRAPWRAPYVSVALHSANLTRVEADIKPGLDASAKDYDAGKQALGERIGLAISFVVSFRSPHSPVSLSTNAMY